MTSKSDERPVQKPGGFDEAPPFSRPIIVEQVPEAGTDLVIAATAEECSALALLVGLVGIAKLEGDFHLAHRPRRGFNVSGSVKAVVTQTCVVSLEPFETMVTETVNVNFMPMDVLNQDDFGLNQSKIMKTKTQEQTLLNDDDEDPADPIIDGKIDLGTLASEFLVLALDPYPRKPGVRFEEILTDTAEERDSPFAILLNLNKSS